MSYPTSSETTFVGSQIKQGPHATQPLRVGPLGVAAFTTYDFHHIGTYHFEFQFNLAVDQSSQWYNSGEWGILPNQRYKSDARREAAAGVVGNLPEGTWVRLMVIRIGGNNSTVTASVRTS